MEETGVYWKSVWHILAYGVFELVLANAAHIKNVPGRKSDVKDADWISELLAHGLIRASFVPDGPTQEMRTFLRTRKQFVREKASHILRIQKTLEDANIKLDSVITDIIGVSGRKMIEALIAGESGPRQAGRLSRSASEGFTTDLAPGLAWPRYSAASLPVAPSPRSDRRARCRHCQNRPGGGGLHCALSHRRRASEFGAGCQNPCCNANPLRDRHGHEPLCQRCQSRFLGVYLPAQR